MTVIEDTIATKDILLSCDERYEIWELKAVERPHLTLPRQDLDQNQDGRQGDERPEEKSAEEMTSSDIENDDHNCDENSNGDDDENDVLPLLDGCDLPRWRDHQLVTTSPNKQGYLNVGTGCQMMRRESQLPSTVVETKALGRWNDLKSSLLSTSLSKNVARISINDHHDDSGGGFQHPCWFEKQNVPVILDKDVTQHWRAYETCRFENLVDRWGDYHWRFSDTHGHTMTLATYKKYVSSLEGLLDDAPLAVYDSQLHTDERKCLLDDYDVPSCFVSPQRGDLFDIDKNENEDAIVDRQRQQDDDNDEDDDDDDDDGRPPFRWILIGPERSGTGLHIDPLGTHAWVTLIEGMKFWVLFPYGTDPAVIGMTDPQIPSAVWFASDWYQKAIEAVPGAVQILQRPYETVYVPAGWPHLVLNLDFSTAITENYASEYPSFDRINNAVRAQEPSMYASWISSLKFTRPDLFETKSSLASQVEEEEKKDFE